MTLATSNGASAQFHDLVDQAAERLKAGDAPDLEAYVQEHPEHAERLRQIWPSLEMLAALGASRDASASVAPIDIDSADLTERLLGDFRMIREAGRGGMGVVYEAEQISLARRVALKVLPFAGVLDPRQLQRFKNESRAAASLHHAHIVPVFAVGCERGVHYYAMQFIEGQTLEQIIRDLANTNPTRDTSPTRKRGIIDADATIAATDPNSPALSSQPAASTAACAAFSTVSPNSKEHYRAVARLGIQIAEALDHAHGVGITHRDIKPSNLIVDEQGDAWITDFGLAQMEAGASLTQSGELLGTLRYMSPEQASGQTGVLDHRTDIYSLGITLYELLALQPAFQGKSRHELLRQVHDEDPPSLHQASRPGNRDLQTIIFKAISKEPAARYDSAGDLLEDLRRFLADRPIKAVPPTRLQRAGRWARRHTGLVLSALLFFALAAGASTTAALLVNNERNNTEQARQQIQQEQFQTGLERDHADRNFLRSMEAVDKLLTSVALFSLDDSPTSQAVRRDLLQKARDFYVQFLSDNQDDPRVKFETGRTHWRMATVTRQLGDLPAAEQSLKRALAIFTNVDAAKDSSGMDLLLRAKYACEEEFATIAESRGDPQAQLAHVRKMVDIAERIAASEGKTKLFDRNYVLESKGDLAEALARTGEDANARLLYEEVNAAYLGAPLESWPRIARHNASAFFSSYSVFCMTLGELDEAVAASRKDLELAERLIADSPHDAGLKSGAAIARHNLGTMFWMQGQAQEALAESRAANDALRALVAEFPNNAEHCDVLARSHNMIGMSLSSLGRGDEAAAEIRLGLAFHRRLAEKFPQVVDHRESLGKSHTSLGTVLLEMRRFDEAESEFREALKFFEPLAKAEPASVGYQLNLTETLTALAEVLQETERKPEALPLHEQKALLELELVKRFPDDDDQRESLADTYVNIGICAFAVGDDAKVADAAKKAIELFLQLQKSRPDNETYSQLLLNCWNDLAVTLHKQGDLAGAGEAFQNALVIDANNANALRGHALLRAEIDATKAGQGERRNETD